MINTKVKIGVFNVLAQGVCQCGTGYDNFTEDASSKIFEAFQELANQLLTNTSWDSKIMENKIEYKEWTKRLSKFELPPKNKKSYSWMEDNDNCLTFAKTLIGLMNNKGKQKYSNDPKQLIKNITATAEQIEDKQLVKESVTSKKGGSSAGPPSS